MRRINMYDNSLLEAKAHQPKKQSVSTAQPQKKQEGQGKGQGKKQKAQPLERQRTKAARTDSRCARTLQNDKQGQPQLKAQRSDHLLCLPASARLPEGTGSASISTSASIASAITVSSCGRSTHVDKQKDVLTKNRVLVIGSKLRCRGAWPV